MDGDSFTTVGWRYSAEEAPFEPANRPPDNRRKDRIEFLASAVAFGSWEIPYHAITQATLFTPSSLLQILRLTTSTDVFEFVVGRGQLPSSLPFPVVRVAVSPGGELGRGLGRLQATIFATLAISLAALLLLWWRAA